jgi:sterol desaturase/sphingolipid hydroxylase (fatty acid hydroxylase superfamily)
MVFLIIIIFTILNPLVVPFALIYFSAANGETLFVLKKVCLRTSSVVHKNQLMRVYSKWYDQNGTVLLVRILRYTLDGFIFSEVSTLQSAYFASHSKLDCVPGVECVDTPK